MGRPKKQIDEITLLRLREEGKTMKAIAKIVGVSVPTISRRIASLKYQKGILTKYRELQGLQLTEHQARILEAVEAKDFEKADLAELLNAFSTLKKVEIAIQGKESFKLRGLLDHLQALEHSE
ncbi:MAG: helix-turn-helix domain-containing protein [Thermodesulfobacteriota bacterium]|nr:helix-turn-helix domain-containing protein [Thermodesulfobacteriota bacterium]